jgi:hypothetical protein
MPTVRYAENKIFPRRVFLKKLGTFTQSNRVLTIPDPNAEDMGILDDPRKSDEQGGLL